MDINLIVIRFGRLIYLARHLSVAWLAWLIIYRERGLHELLNSILKIDSLHQQILGRSIKLPWFNLLLNLVRDFFFYLVVHVPDRGFKEILYFLLIRSTIVYLVSDMSMMVHLDCIRSLAEHIDQPSHRKLQMPLCIEYFELLQHLRLGLQKFNWIIHTGRLFVDIHIIILSCMVMYLDKGTLKPAESAMKGLFLSVITSNMIFIVKMARNTEELEHKILDRLYLYGLMHALRNPTRHKAKLIEKLGYLHLRRCFSQELSIGCQNYIYLKRTLVLELTDFVFTTLLLLLSFCFKYKTKSE